MHVPFNLFLLLSFLCCSIFVSFWQEDPFIYVCYWKMNSYTSQLSISISHEGLKAPKVVFLTSAYLYCLVCKVDQNIFLDSWTRSIVCEFLTTITCLCAGRKDLYNETRVVYGFRIYPISFVTTHSYIRVDIAQC